MEKQAIYAVTAGSDVTYVKGNGSLYLSSKMSGYQSLEPYIKTTRGVYLLIGNGKAYIGEGVVFNRLTKHAKTKGWAEEVYVFLREDEMTKEDSLQYEGALERYIKTHTTYHIENKATVRDNDLPIGEVIQAFKWLGLTTQEPQEYSVKNIRGEFVFKACRTIHNTLKITETPPSLHWIMGLEFKSLTDIESIANTGLGGW